MKRAFLFAVLLLLMSVPAVIAQDDDEDELNFPDYYPEDYSEIVEASREEGSLIIYGNPPDNNWLPVIDAFNEVYPWIEVESLDLGNSESFERYLAESATDSNTADFIVTNNPQGWLDLVEREEVLEYTSPEEEFLPEFTFQLPNVYTISTDAQVMIYNEILLDEDQRPTGLASLAELIEENPDLFDRAVTMYDLSNPLAFNTNYAWAQELGDEYWELMEVIGSVASPEASGGTQFQKLVQGEYVVSYGLPSTVFLLLPDAEGIADWTFIDDATPIFLRGMGITEGGANPNSAKLFVDFLLSVEGQVALCEGGFTPYREDLSEDACERPLQWYIDNVGEENVIIIAYDEEAGEEREEFVERWEELFGR